MSLLNKNGLIFGFFCCIVFVLSLNSLYSRGLLSFAVYKELQVSRETPAALVAKLDASLNFGYLEAYLNTFLTSAKKHFMVGLPVTYFVFTDLPEKALNITVFHQHNIKIIKVKKYNRWQDISMMRMKTISEVIDTVLQHNFNYVFCFDVDQIFTARFGSEALGESVALLHAHYYKLPKNRFTYDRNPKSKACMTEGDYYYHAAVFGGTCKKVKALADYCYLNIMEDKMNDVEALWHDESHLNKYFWLNKPTKLLSPEYCWDRSLPKNDILIKRLVWAPKDYKKLRIP
ncbi:PREDICTED: N-acetyllactosaminide alpha-1,3-galactosyltransferase-like isoform X2 [Cyprinodon variegatus]|uniref:N-acetyllactosaminide alpha-1,3-galactosyltransferase-like isoform X2 n=1 Tax=Cyprinodon variegatus TaxID=28743 RepID=UPI000742946E|nr:PREDICTED: N-acetyllactosaminide alpha-1,3-galactosyltransferase-like isoform X2 [Cyprinodon variegatus]